MASLRVTFSSPPELLPPRSPELIAKYYHHCQLVAISENGDIVMTCGLVQFLAPILKLFFISLTVRNDGGLKKLIFFDDMQQFRLRYELS